MKNMMKTVFALVAFSAVAVQAEDEVRSKRPAMSTIPNPSARWGVTGGANLFISVEGLVFKIAEDTAPFAYSIDSVNNIRDFHIDTDYEWGFRVAAGYNMSHDKWDLVATYTRFDCTTDTTATPPVGGSLYSYVDTAFTFPSGVTLSKAKNKWDVAYNLLDVELGRQFFVSKFMRFRPKFGLRNLWLSNNQSTKVVVSGSATGYTPGEICKLNNEEHFWGMGVLAGLDTVWGLGQGFALYGNLGFSALFGYFDPDQTVSNAGLTATTNSVHHDYSKHQEVTKGNMDLAFGLRWDKNFYDDRYHIGFNFGFEQHVFYNMNRNYFGDNLYGTFNGISGRDFTMSGFAFGARFDF